MHLLAVYLASVHLTRCAFEHCAPGPRAPTGCASTRRAPGRCISACTSACVSACALARASERVPGQRAPRPPGARNAGRRGLGVFPPAAPRRREERSREGVDGLGDPGGVGGGGGGEVWRGEGVDGER